ncbi:bifunctional purine biosynthesis protein PurH [Alphaproteobacteria bacterium]|nr:bifunctional purine biosynthesis protein PurH [Alphaproteobacteria bacterium]
MGAPIIRRALISVSDKTGLVEFAQFLAERKVEILSTGGSAKALREAGVVVKDVSDHTGFPEIMDGRVKTLHPKIHGGILAIRNDGEHEKAMRDHQIDPIDLVVVTLYPFEETVGRGAPFEECVENIDIGGPAMIRAACKNFAHVAVVVDPDDYARVMKEMEDKDGATSDSLRFSLAAAALARTASYDAAIANWMAESQGLAFPARKVIAGSLKQTLRYGENPHQTAALYVADPKRPGIASACLIQGKELSYNNISDADAAFDLVSEFAEPTVAIIKHANPSGVAMGETIEQAYLRALACDPVSAFGGVIAVNRPLDGATAQEIVKLFTEVVIAPAADEDAIAAFAAKRNLRLLLTGGVPDPGGASMTVKSVGGGFLFQSRDDGRIEKSGLKIVTRRAPTESELRDMLFAFRVCKHVKSNAIVYAKNGATVGIGAGQMSRVDSSRIAAWKAREAAEKAGLAQPETVGSVVASDAFFPFSDGLIAATEAGATAVIQPGGSIRDDEVIKAADDANLAMVFTDMRHFRH